MYQARTITVMTRDKLILGVNTSLRLGVGCRGTGCKDWYWDLGRVGWLTVKSPTGLPFCCPSSSFFKALSAMHRQRLHDWVLEIEQLMVNWQRYIYWQWYNCSHITYLSIWDKNLVSKMPCVLSLSEIFPRNSRPCFVNLIRMLRTISPKYIPLIIFSNLENNQNISMKENLHKNHWKSAVHCL